MGKNLRDMTRQEQAAYFKSKDFCGEELKIVMDAISYGISADYLQLFEDTTVQTESQNRHKSATTYKKQMAAACFFPFIRDTPSITICLSKLF